jgi:hypothetical protein
MEELKDHIVDAVIFVKITYDKYKNDPDYMTTPFGMINLCMGIMMSWSLSTIIVSTLFHFEASTGFTTYALSWIYFVYAVGGAVILNKKQEPMLIGAVIGAGAMLCMVSFTQACHFYSLSGCPQVAHHSDRWSCTKPLKNTLWYAAAYEFCFSVFLGAAVGLTYIYRNVVLAEGGQYVEVNNNGIDRGTFGEVDDSTPLKRSSNPNIAL